MHPSSRRSASRARFRDALPWMLLGVFVAGWVAPPASAQPAATVASGTSPGAYVSHRMDGPAVVVEGENARARVTFYRPDIARVDWLRPGQAPDSSYAVVAKPMDAPPAVHGADDRLWIRSSGMTLGVQKNPLRIRMRDATGRALLAEADANVALADTANTLRVHLPAGAPLYGSGERSPFNLRGAAFDLYNTQTYGYNEAPPVMKINIPLLVSPERYGLFVDSTHPAHFDLCKTDATRAALTVEGGALTYYVLGAASIREQLEQYTHLTGRAPMPPKWSLGYLQSKMAYRTEAAARGVVDTLRQKQFPVDALIIDLAWFEHMGDLTWNRDAFPTPFQMMEDLGDRGVKTIGITETYLVRPSRLFQPAIDQGFVGATPDGAPYIIPDWWSCDGCDAALLDVTHPAAQDWWWRQHPPFMGDGMDALWTDLGEPETHPMDMQHHAGPTSKIHNVYNLLWAQLLFDNWQSVRPNTRLLNLTRAGSPGIQRYGTALWSGDVGRSFVALREQTPLMLNMGLSGVPYYSSDLGGFTGDRPSPELFVRWFQQGALSPTMRPHGTDNAPTEPWRYGAAAEEAIRTVTHLRYRLLPYLYTLAWEAHRTGLPLARPLFFADPTDAALHAVDDAYLVGDALLVAPVLEDGARSKTVRLPSGTWIEHSTDVAHAGGQSVTVDAPLARLPLFVRAGSILPTRPVALHTEAQPADTLGLTLYPDADTPESTFTLYEDDGASLNYRDGAYALTRITQRLGPAADGGQRLVLQMEATAGAYADAPAARTVQVVAHRIADAPTQVTRNGELLPARTDRAMLARDGGWLYDAAQDRLHVRWRGPTDAAHHVVATGLRVGGEQ